MSKVTVRNSIYIRNSPEVVWDYTQDYSKRRDWDRSVLEAAVISAQPRQVRIKGIGGLVTELHYKLDDRPHKTTLVMVNTSSPLIEGGGGSWEYLPEGDGTIWTQTNTIILKGVLLARLLKPFISLAMKRNVRNAMEKAKKIIEQRLEE